MKLKLWILLCIIALILSVAIATFTLVMKPNQALFWTMLLGFLLAIFLGLVLFESE